MSINKFDPLCKSSLNWQGDVRDPALAQLAWWVPQATPERGFFIANLLIRIHFIIVMIRWTGLAPWESGFPFPRSLTSNINNCGVFGPDPARQVRRVMVFLMPH